MKPQLTHHYYCCKRNLGLSWEDIGRRLEMSPVWTTSALLGMNSHCLPTRRSALCEAAQAGQRLC